MKTPLSRLLRDRSGNAVIETALYLPLALMVFAGTVDFAQAVSQKLLAQQAVSRTLELASNAALGQLSETLLRAEAAQAARVPLSDVQARIWVECNGVVQAAGTTGCANSDGLARYAGLTINSSYQLMLYPRLVQSFRGSNRFQVQGSLRIQ